ncbi:hypothetical protein KUTeg_024997 [Tegillarca granosa]|uniref:Uncharacterized protein n=1 Tax=Tegillarca granosa TaxID=220873 RepID=A0ABQ9E405_TEGGR|nr:hypothetical protein KUTeg_024997 [Tegillarca granosa]
MPPPKLVRKRSFDRTVTKKCPKCEDKPSQSSTTSEPPPPPPPPPPVSPKKRRGRPKGTPNKDKDGKMKSNKPTNKTPNKEKETEEEEAEKEKEVPEEDPYSNISAEKTWQLSMILADINRKFTSQAFNPV